MRDVNLMLEAHNLVRRLDAVVACARDKCERERAKRIRNEAWRRTRRRAHAAKREIETMLNVMSLYVNIRDR